MDLQSASASASGVSRRMPATDEFVRVASTLPNGVLEDLKRAADAFFWFQPEQQRVIQRDAAGTALTTSKGALKMMVLQSTLRPARESITEEQIVQAWSDVLFWRRTVEADDTAPISDSAVVAKAYTNWTHHWIENELRPDQQRLDYSNKTSIFNAYLRRIYGSKYFVLALISTGITWGFPPWEVPRGATEHTANHLADWFRRLAASIDQHRQDEETRRARKRSGHEHGVTGLTPEQEAVRHRRTRARQTLWWAKELEADLLASRGKGKGKGRNKGKGKGKGFL